MPMYEIRCDLRVEADDVEDAMERAEKIANDLNEMCDLSADEHVSLSVGERDECVELDEEDLEDDE